MTPEEEYDKEKKKEEEEKIKNGFLKAPIGNHYGTPTVVKRDGKCIFFITNWDGEDMVEVSQQFYDAFVAEFSKPKEVVKTPW